MVGYGGMGGEPDTLRTRYSSRVQARSFDRVHGYNNGQFEDLASKQLTTVDQGERKRIMQEAQAILAEDVPLISLYLPTRIEIFVKKTFDAWYFTPGGVFGGYPGILNKHVFVTGKKASF